MNILLIGTSGFVSGTLARLALEAGHHVWGVSRGKRPAPAGVRTLQADRKDRDAFAQALLDARPAWDLVVDCIGFHAEDAQQDVDLLAGRTGHFVFVSTDFVYDPAKRTFPQRVDNPHFTSADYGRGKRSCERILEECDTNRLPWTILRPCHIYGPGSLLGCLPAHGRDPELLARLRRGETLRLVGGGHFLQQPVLAADLARLILSCAGNAAAVGQTYHAAGPDIIEAREYFRIVAEALGVELRVEELPVADYLRDHPSAAPFLCHRVYDIAALQRDGLAVPATPIAAGLRAHVADLA